MRNRKAVQQRESTSPIWRELQVWRDDNGEVHSAAEELHPLADFDITAIALAPTEVDETDAAGNRISHRGTVRLSDESSRDAADVWFRVNPALSVYRGDGEVAPEIAALPDVRAFSNVVSLPIAMQQDAGLEGGKWTCAIQIQKVLKGAAVAEAAYEKTMRDGVLAAPAVNAKKARKPMKMGKAAWPFDVQRLERRQRGFIPVPLKMDNN